MSKQYEALIQQAAARYGVDPALIRAVMHQESGGNPTARSNKGASGLMQLMPGTAKSLGVTDINDPGQNIDAGVRYLAQQLHAFGSPELALAAYNAGPRAVRRYKGIPPYAETQNYVTRIMGNYRNAPAQAFQASASASAAASTPNSAGSTPRYASHQFSQPVRYKKPEYAPVFPALGLAGVAGMPPVSSPRGLANMSSSSMVQSGRAPNAPLMGSSFGVAQAAALRKGTTVQEEYGNLTGRRIYTNEEAINGASSRSAMSLEQVVSNLFANKLPSDDGYGDRKPGQFDPGEGMSTRINRLEPQLDIPKSHSNNATHTGNPASHNAVQPEYHQLDGFQQPFISVLDALKKKFNLNMA